MRTPPDLRRATPPRKGISKKTNPRRDPPRGSRLETNRRLGAIRLLGAPGRWAVCFCEPLFSLRYVKANEMTPLHKWNPPLGDEATNVAHPDAESIGNCRDVDELRKPLLSGTIRLHGNIA